MSAKVYELLLLKVNFEHVTGLEITDTQWNEVADDIMGRLDNFYAELIELIGADLADEMHDKIEMGA
jgi:hypothetical protein